MPTQFVDTTLTAAELAAMLVGPGVEISNVSFTGDAAARGSFAFSDATVVGFDQGIVLSSGSAASVVGPNLADDTTTDFAGPGDADLTTLAGYETYDAAVLEFDFIPTANQVVFFYTFASEEYPEWVSTPFNDVFAFYVNGTNYAVVRQIGGDPLAPDVPVAVNNINNGNALYPEFTPMRPDLFRANYFNADGASAIDLEMDGITKVLTFQAPVIPNEINHMKLAIADASDWILDSAVFIQAGSLVSNENPVADLSLEPSSGAAPLTVTAIIEGEDPNWDPDGPPLTYTINWGDNSPDSTGELLDPQDESEKTALEYHTYVTGGTFYVTLTVSNGLLSGASIEDVDVSGGVNTAPNVTSHPADQILFEGDVFTFSAAASGVPTPTVQWQVGTSASGTFVDIPGATATAYIATASLTDDGTWYQAVFTNSVDSVTTDPALLTVSPLPDTTPPAAPGVALTVDSGSSPTDKLTNLGDLTITAKEAGALVEYFTDDSGTWDIGFTAVEGLNTVQVRQTDTAGNVGEATTFSFTLDTTPPAFAPTFSAPPPFHVGALGITVSGNPTDLSGIDAQSNGVVDTSTAGSKVVICTATDNAGNIASVDVPYVVAAYEAINVLPLDGATFRRSAAIPVSFQLVDASGLISDQAAASLAPGITVTFDGLSPVGVKYNKKTDTFSATLKMNKPAAGPYDVSILVAVDGVNVMTVMIPVNVV